MNQITTHERPGVYSSYRASSLIAASKNGGNVAVVAQGNGNELYTWTSYGKALSQGGDTSLTRMAALALKNGAALVYAMPAGEDYAAAFEVIAALEDVAVVVCDSSDLTVQQALRDMVESCSANRRERIAVVYPAENETAAGAAARAAELNHQRVVLVCPGTAEHAAALAGAIAGNADPALPLSGGKLEGVSVPGRWEEGDIDLLVQGGVTPLEGVAGSCYVVRAVTTRTTTGEAPDATWRELSTILVVDEVIPALRNALRAKFARTKNTEQTRGAIRSQVIMELENRVEREIIDSYEGVTVTADETDPTLCLVEFAFTVTHGLNQIWLSAHITV